MSDELCFLITLLYGDELLKVAVKVKQDRLPGDVADFPMEPENRETLWNLLPRHVQSLGPIVAVDYIFEVVDLGKSKMPLTTDAEQ